MSRFLSISSMLVVVLLSAATLSAKRVDLADPAADGRDIQVTVLSAEPARTVLQVDLLGFDLNPVTIDQSTFYGVSCRGAYAPGGAGDPGLPLTAASLVIPDGARVTVRVVETSFQEFTATPVAPSKGKILRTTDPALIPYSFSEAYALPGWWPSDPVVSGDGYTFRDCHGVDLTIRPFQYSAEEQSLRAIKSMVLEVVCDGGTEQSLTQPKAVVQAFDEMYARHFVNYRLMTEKYQHVSEEGDMLIIAGDALCDTLAQFVAWKKQKGIDVTLTPLSQITGSADTIQIHDYIRAMYTANPNLAYVLLVGDSYEMVAPYGGYSGYQGPADPIYGRVAGDDAYADLIVGRFCGHTPGDVFNILKRGIWYERDLVDDGTVDWLTRSLGIATDEQGDMSHMQSLVLYLSMHGYTVDALYEYAGSTPTAAEVTAALNNGRGYVNYAGHGSNISWATTGFTTTHVQQLQNGWKLPFIVSAACLNGAYDQGECFAEKWLKVVSYSGEPEGAVAAWMSARQSSFAGGQTGQEEVASLLITGVNHTFGGACFNAANWMIASGDIAAAEIWTVFGDPSLMVRTAVPEPMAVTMSGAVDWDATTYSATVIDPVTGLPIEDAVCALYCGGTLHGRAITDASGTAIIPLIPNSPMFCNEATLTATAFNRETVQEPVTVVHDLAIWTEPLGETRNCIENPIEPQGYWIECEVFSSDPLANPPTLWWTTSEYMWMHPWMTDLGNNKWGFFLPLQYAGTTIQYHIAAENTDGDQYDTPTYSFSITDFGVALSVDDSTMAGFYGKTVWYDLTVTNAGILEDAYQLSVADNEWPTRIYDANGQFEISSTAMLQMGGEFAFKVAVDIGSDGIGDIDTLTVTATSGIDPQESASRAVLAESKGVTLSLPFEDYFSDIYVDASKWKLVFDCPTSLEALYDHFECWPNALGLGSGSSHLGCSYTQTSQPIDLSGIGSDYYLEYWIECGGAANCPEPGDYLQVDYLNVAGNWTPLATHIVPPKPPDETFRRIRDTLPIAARYEGFQLRFTAHSTNNFPDGDDPEPPIGWEPLDIWFIDNVHIGTEPPGAPTLVSPPDNDTSTSAYPYLSWQAVPGASQYQVIIDTGWIDGDVHAFAITDGLGWTVTPALPIGTSRWKVRAKGETTPWGPWSAERTFTRIRYVPPPSCPVLFSKRGSEYVEHNPLLTACERSDYQDVVTDYYHVGPDVPVESGRVTFQMREMEDEVTYLDDFQLMTVDHSAESQVAVTVDGEVLLYRESLAPSSVVDQNGEDCTTALLSEDGASFNADGPGSLTITFDPPDGTRGVLLLPGGIKDLCNIDKLTTEPSPALSHMQVALETTGGAIEAPVIPTRVNVHTAAVMVGASPREDGKVVARLSWNRSYRSDVVRLALLVDERPVITRERAASRDVVAGAARVVSDGEQAGRIVLNKGDIVEYGFEVGAQAPSHLVRDYVVVATGRYEPTSRLADGLRPDRFELHANYPNPFNPTTTISFALPQAERVTLEIFNVLGERVCTLIDGRMEAGHHAIEWDAGPYASGVYLYRLQAGDFVDSRKMVLLR